MYRRCGVIGLVTFAAVVGSVLPASAATLKCGDKVSTNIVLTKDLTCVGTALHLVIGETQTLTVNLNGHRLKGNGTGTGLETDLFKPGSVAGTLVVTNGTITGFDVALVGPGTYSPGLLNLTAKNVRLTSNGSWQPRRVQYATVVEDSVLTDTGSGGALTDRSSLTARRTTFLRSSVQSTSQSSNYLYDNLFDGGTFSANVSSNLTATGNTFRNCGIAVRLADTDSRGVTLVGNTVKNCQGGVRLDGGVYGPVTIQGNSFVDNTGTGVSFLNAYNRAVTISGNTFLRNAGDGLAGAATNLGAGPAAGSGPTKITGNTANSNTGLGIKVTGVIVDGGFNRAKLNGNPAQCLGVVCTP